MLLKDGRWDCPVCWVVFDVTAANKNDNALFLILDPPIFLMSFLIPIRSRETRNALVAPCPLCLRVCCGAFRVYTAGGHPFFQQSCSHPGCFHGSGRMFSGCTVFPALQKKEADKETEADDGNCQTGSLRTDRTFGERNRICKGSILPNGRISPGKTERVQKTEIPVYKSILLILNLPDRFTKAGRLWYNNCVTCSQDRLYRSVRLCRNIRRICRNESH